MAVPLRIETGARPNPGVSGRATLQPLALSYRGPASGSRWAPRNNGMKVGTGSKHPLPSLGTCKWGAPGNALAGDGCWPRTIHSLHRKDTHIKSAQHIQALNRHLTNEGKVSESPGVLPENQLQDPRGGRTLPQAPPFPKGLRATGCLPRPLSSVPGVTSRPGKGLGCWPLCCRMNGFPSSI